MPSFPSEPMRRLGAVALFAACMAASTVIYRGMTPVTGLPPVPPFVRHPIDRAVELLAQARRPYDRVTFCEPLKAYVPERVVLYGGGVHVPEAPAGRVIVCMKGAEDYGQAVSKAGAEGLSWVRQVDGTPLMVFARDEAQFRAAVAQAGAPGLAASVHEVSPLLEGLRSNHAKVTEEANSWEIAAHGDDDLVLFGPYVDLAQGAYRLRLRGRFIGSEAQCRAAVAAFHPTVEVTGEAGKATLQPRASIAVTQPAGQPCRLEMERALVIGMGGAKQVETPFYGATTLPLEIDGYALEAASAQSR